MEWDLFAKIVDESASEPLLSTVVYELQNEPLIDKRIFDCVKHFKSINSNTRCLLVTNGELLDRFSLTDIVQSDMDRMVVSLNAHSKEMYESINNGLDYEKVMQNISYLLSDNRTKQKLALSFVFTEQSVHEVRQAVKYWREKGVETRVIGLVNRAGTLYDYEELRLKTGYHDKLSLSWLRRRLMSRLGGIVGCHLPFYQMCILFNGDAIICCHDWNRAVVVGNVKASSLREIWNSERMNKIRRLLLRKRYEQIDSCKGCSLVEKN